jgi:hypothetical protein
MSTERIEETCSCGARFVWSGWPGYAAKRLTAWRQDHRHAEAVGICADQPSPITYPDGSTSQSWCELLAGHLGAHSDGTGCHWSKPDPLEAMQARVNDTIRNQEWIADHGCFPPRRQPAAEETP